MHREGIGTSGDRDLSYYETPIGKNAGYDISSFNVGNGIFVVKLCLQWWKIGAIWFIWHGYRFETPNNI